MPGFVRRLRFGCFAVPQSLMTKVTAFRNVKKTKQLQFVAVVVLLFCV
jgi:hypothetical protein